MDDPEYTGDRSNQSSGGRDWGTTKVDIRKDGGKIDCDVEMK